MTIAQARQLRAQGLPLCQETWHENPPGTAQSSEGPCPHPPDQQFLPSERPPPGSNIVKVCNGYTMDLGDLHPDTADYVLELEHGLHEQNPRYICTLCTADNANSYMPQWGGQPIPPDQEIGTRLCKPFTRNPVCEECEQEAIRNYPFGNGKSMCQVRMEEGKTTKSSEKGPRCSDCIKWFNDSLHDIARDYARKLRAVHRRPQDNSR